MFRFVDSVDDVYALSEKLEKAGCPFQKKPDEGECPVVVVVICDESQCKKSNTLQHNSTTFSQ